MNVRSDGRQIDEYPATMNDNNNQFELSAANSTPVKRRQFMALLSSASGAFLLTDCASKPEAKSTPPTGPAPRLPWGTVFKGDAKFQQVCNQAERGNWAALPIGQRTTTVGRALLGTAYGNYTLEIDDRIESPSVNLHQLDCWTFYEVSLAFARMVRSKPAPWSPSDLLRYVEVERYRGGHCDGTYLSRMHHLEEVFYDNERRGLGRNLTRSLGGVPIHRNIREMQITWRSYRYLSHNPSLVSGIAKVEARVSRLPVTYIPRSRVEGIESSLQNGDVLAIAARDNSGYTSHVGLALRDGRHCRFMHATSSRDKGRCCIIDSRISTYLKEKSGNIGLIVFRPGDALFVA